MNTLRTKPDLSKQTHAFQFDSLKGSLSHMCGWRQTMQDADICQTNLGNQKLSLFAIFDGHGGAEVALFTKKHFVQELTKNINFINKNYEQALLQTFPKMDQLMMSEKGSEQLFAIKQVLDEEIKKTHNFQYEQDQQDQITCIAGTTALVCLITQSDIYIASLGDSRCIISFENQFKQFTIQHKPTLPQQKSRIQKAGGKVKNGRINGKLSMSRSIGDFEFKAKKNLKAHQQMVITIPQIQNIKNQNINYILMGCDGVWEGKQIRWYEQVVKDAISKQKDIDYGKIIQNIFEQVVAKDHNGDDGHDNMTAILIVPKK